MSFIPSLIRTLKRFSSNQRSLYWTFISILMITNTVLLFTEPMSFPAGIAYIALPLGIQLLLLASVKKPGTMFLILLPKSILDAFQLVLIKLFGGSIIAVDMFLNLVTTSATEAGELLSNLWPVILFLLIVYIPAIVLAIRSVRNPLPSRPIFRRRMYRISAALLLIGTAGAAGARMMPPKIPDTAGEPFEYEQSRFSVKNDIYPCNVLYNMAFAFRKLIRIADYPETSAGFSFGAVREETGTLNEKPREICVLVLGETARACNWSLYGYPRKTSPRLDSLPGLVVFRDAMTQANTTHKIVPLILSPADAENYEIIYSSKSIVSAFKEAGFKTIFLTNQEYNQSFAHYYYEEADIRRSVRKDGSTDHQMLPLFEELIERESGNLFIIVHLYGSHFNYHERYPDEFRRFVPDKAEEISRKYYRELVNSFDNTILYTDDLITRIIRTVEKTGAAGSVLYLSDHGEDIMDDARRRFLHSSPVPTYYQLHIPYFIWFSGEYGQMYPDKVRAARQNRNTPISNNTVFHTLLDMAAIRTPYLDSTLSVCSPRLLHLPRTYLTDHDGCSPIDRLRLTDYDRQQFRERKLEYRFNDTQPDYTNSIKTKNTDNE